MRYGYSTEVILNCGACGAKKYDSKQATIDVWNERVCDK